MHPVAVSLLPSALVDRDMPWLTQGVKQQSVIYRPLSPFRGSHC